MDASKTRTLLPCLYLTSYKIGKRAYNEAELHRKQYFGTPQLGAYVLSVRISNQVYCELQGIAYKPSLL